MPSSGTYARKDKTLHVSKTLQTELQAMIAFVCYDSNELRDSGKTMKKDVLAQKLYDLYMPPNSKKDNRLRMIEMFLIGSGKFKGLFYCIDGVSTPNSLVIPNELHNLDHCDVQGVVSEVSEGDNDVMAELNDDGDVIIFDDDEHTESET